MVKGTVLLVHTHPCKTIIGFICFWQPFGLVIIEKSGYFLSAFHHPMLFHIQPVVPFLKSHHITHQRPECHKIKLWRRSLFLSGGRSQPWNCQSVHQWRRILSHTSRHQHPASCSSGTWTQFQKCRRMQAGVRQSLLHCYRNATM